MSSAIFAQGVTLGGRFVLDRALSPAVWIALDRDALEVVVVRVTESLAVAERGYAALARASAAAPRVGPSPRAFGPHEARGFLARERVEGETLDEVLASCGRLSVERFELVLRSLCASVALLHRAGIVHGNLSLEHVIPAPNVAPLLGLDSVYAPPPGVVVGAPHTLSDRRWMGRPPSVADDVWALGLIAYHALTGRSYWRKSDSFGIATEAIAGALEPPSVRAPRDATMIPSELSRFDDWFLACVAREDSRRYSDAIEAADALESMVFGRFAAAPNDSAASDVLSPQVCLNVASISDWDDD